MSFDSPTSQTNEGILTHGDSSREFIVVPHEALPGGFEDSHEVAALVHSIRVQPNETLQGGEPVAIHLKFVLSVYRFWKKMHRS